MPSVIIVEDDPFVREMLELVLRTDGFDTEGIADGAAALARLQGPPADLVLLDVMMPQVDGLEVLRALRRLPPWAGTSVVVATALSTDQDVWTGWQAGADYYLTKPLDVEELRQVASRLVRFGEVDAGG